MTLGTEKPIPETFPRAPFSFLLSLPILFRAPPPEKERFHPRNAAATQPQPRLPLTLPGRGQKKRNRYKVGKGIWHRLTKHFFLFRSSVISQSGRIWSTPPPQKKSPKAGANISTHSNFWFGGGYSLTQKWAQSCESQVCVTRKEVDFFFGVSDTDYGLWLLVRRKVMGNGVCLPCWDRGRGTSGTLSFASSKCDGWFA